MPYTEAFMTEVFRFGSITPLALHGNPEETTLDGYRIPKRTWIIGNIWGIHWDKKVGLRDLYAKYIPIRIIRNYPIFFNDTKTKSISVILSYSL